MKRKIAFIMTLMLALLCCVSGPANAAGATPVIVWENCSLQLLRYKVFKSEHSSADMNLYVRAVNNNDFGLAIWFRDAEIDGVSVLMAPIGMDPGSDSGAEDPRSIYIFTTKDDKDASSKAIENGKTLSMTMEFQKEETKEVLFTQKISIDLDVLDGIRDIATPRPTRTPAPHKTPTPTSTPAPDNSDYGNNPPPYNPASRNYTGLKEGSSGQAVKDVQQRLWDLGYYRDKINGEFGLTTTIAVRSFCEQNGLPVSNNVTPEMQTLLYSSGAKYHEMPYIPLVIGPYYKWDNPNYADNIGWFYPQVVNRGDRAIRGFELYYYFENVWGKVLTGDSQGSYLYPSPFTQTIKPGYCEYVSAGFPVSPFASVYTVYVGIHKIVFDDGEIREIPVKDITYYSCTIKN